MSEVTSTTFQPLYTSKALNEPIILSEEELQVTTSGGKVYSGNGCVSLSFLPKPSVDLVMDVEEHGFIGIGLNGVTSIYSLVRKSDVPGSACGMSSSLFPTPSVKVKWHVYGEPRDALGCDTTELESVVFHLFNYKEIYGTRASSEKSGTTTHRINHIDLKWNDWTIEIKSLFSTSDTIKALKANNGCGLTHVGEIRNKNSQLFTVSEAKELLIGLRFFIAFSKGGWCHPALPAGFSGDGEKVWEHWTEPSQLWKKPMSWCDHFHGGKQLEALFPGFMNKWQDEDWHAAFKEVLYWYFNANESERGVDSGIILTQTALERLAYEYLTQSQKVMSKKEFGKLRAADKIEQLLRLLNISVDLPNSLERMKKLEPIRSWAHAPHAITDIRNSLVHPGKKSKALFDHLVMFEAWSLGLWYLELVILRLCGYDEDYSNRLATRFSGEVEKVPWMNHEEQ